MFRSHPVRPSITIILSLRSAPAPVGVPGCGALLGASWVGADDGALVMTSAPGVALRMGTPGLAVAASRGPPVNRDQAMPVSQSTNNACLMSRQNMIAVPGGKASHHGSGRGAVMVLADLKGRSLQLEFPSLLSGPVTGLCSTYRRSRRRSSAFFDHAMTPISSWPSTMYGSIGLMGGDESRRSVPGKATRAQ